MKDIYGAPIKSKEEVLATIKLEVNREKIPAKITRIWGTAGDPRRWGNEQEDELNIWLEPTKHIDGILSFGINLPARRYTRDELLKAIIERGSRRLTELIKEHENEQIAFDFKKQHQATVDSLTYDMQELLKGDENTA